MTFSRAELPDFIKLACGALPEEPKGESPINEQTCADLLGDSTTITIDGYWVDIANFVTNAGQHPVAQCVIYCWQNKTADSECRFVKINFRHAGDPNTPLHSPRVIPGSDNLEFFMHVSMVSAVLATLQLGPCKAIFQPQVTANTPYGQIALIDVVKV